MNLKRTILFWICAGSLLAQIEPPTQPEYGGPAVLSRAGGPSNMSRAPATLRPYVGVSAVYDTGLTGLIIDKNGNVADQAAYGVEGSAGLYGSHAWKHTLLNMDYRGDYRHYARASYYDGSNQFLNLSVAHQATRHLTFNLGVAAGTFTFSNGYGGIGFYDPSLFGIPITNVFDNRTNYYGTSGGLTYQKSARLSFNFTGSGYVVRRQSSALFGITGYVATADVVYRLTKFTSIGAEYDFTHFDFLKAFGASDMHAGALNLGFRLSRGWELALRGGAYRVETLFLQSVQLDPAVAAITGQTAGVVASYGLHYYPLAAVRLAYSTRRSVTSLSASRIVTGGNGMILAGRDDAVTASFSYTGVRRWNFGVDAGYDALYSTFQQMGSYRNYHGGWGVTRSLGSGLHAVLRFDARRFDLKGLPAAFNRLQYRASLGLNYSPGDLPLRLW